MPQHARRTEPGPAPRHAVRARSLNSRRARALACAAVVAGGTAFVAGPATAHENDSPAAAPIAAAPATDALGPLVVADPVDAFAAVLEAGHQRQVVAAAVARERALAEARERKEALAKQRARELAAKVRASRAGLRSDVVRPISGGYRLTARFGDNSSRWGSGTHTGLDFACSTGTAVRAAADGVIISAGYDGAYGNRIELRHADGTVTTYSHLSAIEIHGGSVDAGDVIGRVGSTGNTTGAHLHFEVMVNGNHVDPEHWMSARYVSY